MDRHISVMADCFRVVLMGVVSVWCLQGDVVTLKNGEVVNGTFLSGTSRSIKVEAGGAIRTFDLGQVANISFVDGESGGSVAHPPTQSGISRIIIPANTTIKVRVVDAVDSGTAHTGQIFAAAVDEPVTVGGSELIKKDAPVQLRLLSESLTPGQLTLVITLSAVTINGKTVPISTANLKSSASAPNSNAEAARVGSGTSALASAASRLGAGSAVSTIGSAAGTVVSTGGQLTVRGPKIKIPVGTQLVFQTQGQTTY